METIPVKTQLGSLAGVVLAPLFPVRSEQLEQGQRDATDLLDRLIVSGSKWQAVRFRDDVALRKMHRRFWKGRRGAETLEKTEWRFQKWFLKDHAVVLRWLDRQMKLERNGRHRIVEIGCGTGMLCEHMLRTFDRIDNIIGVDLNAIVTESNVRRNTDNRLQFINDDLMNWSRYGLEDGDVLVANGGVLEYLDPSALRFFFETIAKKRNIALVVVEPYEDAHDLDFGPMTTIFGYERSFSHSLARYMSRAGFNILQKDRSITGGFHWQMLMATNS